MGATRITTADGEDITPRGVRARALIGLLCVSADHQRSRRWVQSTFWSDREPSQSSGSLRQCLREIRRAHPLLDAVLLPGRETLSLRADLCHIDIHHDKQASLAAVRDGRQLMEDLAAPDVKFVEWLDKERARVAHDLARAGVVLAPPQQGPEASPAFALVVRQATAGPAAGLVGQVCISRLSGLLKDIAHVQVSTDSDAAIFGPRHALYLDVLVCTQADRCQFVVDLKSGSKGYTLQTITETIALGPSMQDSVALSRLVYVLAELCLKEFERQARSRADDLRAGALIVRSQRDIFSFNPKRLNAAEDNLRTAALLAPDPKIAAWRSFLRVVASVESNPEDRARLVAEADDLADLALEDAGDSPLVLSLLSHVRLILHGQLEVGAALSRDAIRLQPNNPFPFVSLSAAHSRAGNYALSLSAAQRGREIARLSAHKHWWDFSVCLAELASGNTDGAIKSAEAARARSPGFLPPQRYLYALYAHRGDVEKAAAVAEAIRRKEPDFSLYRMRNDPDYPAGILRISDAIGAKDV